ncbi:type II secretion system protein [Metabacillus fastidiosus]|uniref:type II secretion system protein n=1 Tax=Metabacillus fastidiosus TaxID=1458 RepID=UPI003D2A6E17
MMKKLVKNQRGLTLIELLAVIVILGIIAAIAVPAVNAIMNKSKEDSLVIEARNVVNAAKLYAAAEKPDTVTLTQADNKLDNYLENKPDEFSIVVTNNNGSYSYGNVTVKKNGKREIYNSTTFAKTTTN